MEPPTIHLGSGASHRAHLEAGTRLLVRRGGVLVTPAPVWLAETCLRGSRRLVAEETHVLAAAGWVEIQAAVDAEVAIVLTRRSGRPAWADRWLAIARRLTAPRPSPKMRP